MRASGKLRIREAAYKLALETIEELLGLIHNLFTRSLLIRRKQTRKMRISGKKDAIGTANEWRNRDAAREGKIQARFST
jgi:hypothetical protein